MLGRVRAVSGTRVHVDIITLAQPACWHCGREEGEERDDGEEAHANDDDDDDCFGAIELGWWIGGLKIVGVDVIMKGWLVSITLYPDWYVLDL